MTTNKSDNLFTILVVVAIVIYTLAFGAFRDRERKKLEEIDRNR